VLLAKEETVLQATKDELVETGRCYGVEMNVERTKEIRIPTKPTPIQITIEYKQAENVEYFNYFCSLITNYARYEHEIKSSIVMTKAAFNKKRAVFTSKVELNLRN
jgi:hypothetical protein